MNDDARGGHPEPGRGSSDTARNRAELERPGEVDDVVAEVRAALVRSDDVAKAAPGARDPAAVRERARQVLAGARDLLDTARAHLSDEVVDDLSVQVTRRMLDLDGADLLEGAEEPPPGMGRAPTKGVDPARIPPGQHLTPGFPVLHVGSAPSNTDGWSITVAGHVHDRIRIPLADLRSHESTVEVTRDFHCVTTWSRLDVTWTGVPVAPLLEQAGPRATATHALVYGHPAYSTNLAIADLMAEGVLLAWAVDGMELPVAHGGPLRLVVPHLYGWKSVKWATEIRLVDHEVPGYWEERGYHRRGDPWSEQRLR